MKIRAYIKRKLNSEEGFSLGELLVAVLILLMVATIVTAGIPVAREAYYDVVLASNAEIALSTTISTLKNEIGAATEVDDSEESNLGIKYYNSSRGTNSRIFVSSANTEIKFQRYYAAGGIGQETDPEILIHTKTATNELYVTCKNIRYSKESKIVEFTDIKVKKGDRVLTERPYLSIRVLAD